MAFSDQFLDELRARVGLADVIGRRVKLTRKGREHQGLCPFHKEKTPSFTVNEEKGFYHCFGCQAHGSVFDFVMETEGLNFPEAVEKLAGEAGLEVPRDTPEERERQKRRATLMDVSELAAGMFEKMLRLPEGKAALAYLKGRGLDDDTIKRFRLGFAPAGRHWMKTALARENVPEDLAVQAGLLIRPPDDRGGDRTPYDRFRGRVMFPIADRRGRIIAFGGRMLDGTAGAGLGRPAENKGPKYLNSPETPLFHKGTTLYGLDLAAPAARQAGTIVVAEGYMDVIALAKAGFAHAVAPLGTALTEDQIRLLWKVVREPVLCFDGDNAGQRAAQKAAERALAHLKPGYGLRFAALPPGDDPDTLIAGQGPGAMSAVLDAALPLSEVLWQAESGGRIPASAEDRAALQDRLDGHTRQIQDPTVRTHFSRVFGERLWPGQERAASGATGRNRGRPGRGGWAPNIHVRPEKVVETPLERRGEDILLALIINHPETADEIGERLGTMSFSTPELDFMRQEVLKTLAENPGLETEALVNHLYDCGYSAALGRVLSSETYEHGSFARPDATADFALKGFEERYRRLQSRDLAKEIEEAKRASQENPTEEAKRRLQVLINQQLSLANDDDENGHYPRS